MKTHELKLDIKYFDDVKSGKKKFEIRKNDRDFVVGDILDLKAWDSSLGQYAFKKKDEKWHSYGRLADTIKVKVVDIIIPKDWWSILNKFGINNGPVMTKHGFMFLPKEVLTVLEDYFYSDRLPDGHVVLGIEVLK